MSFQFRMASQKTRQRPHIPLYCDRPTQTQPQDYSEVGLFDFPPIKEGSSRPLLPPSPRYRPQVGQPASPAQATWTSEEELPQSPQPRPSRRQQGLGLGQTNVLNRVPAQSAKVRDIYAHSVTATLNIIDYGCLVLIRPNPGTLVLLVDLKTLVVNAH